MALDVPTEKLVTRPLPTNYRDSEEWVFGPHRSVTLRCGNLIPKPRSFYYANAHGLFDWSGKLYEPSMAYPQEVPMMHRGYFWSRFAVKRKERIRTPSLIISNKSTRNYYHWHADILPKLVNAKRSRHYTPALAVAIHEKFLKYEFVREGLRIFWPGPVIPLKEDCFYWFDELYFADHTAPRMNQDPELVREVVRTLIAAMPPGTVNTNRAKATRRIYIKRGATAEKKRRIVNEVELLALLEARGFETVQFETLSYAEQIAFSSTCEVMLSINGAGFANAIFMPAPATLLEFRSDRPAPISFWPLANVCGHQYLYLLGERLEGAPEDHIGSLTIDLAELARTLDTHVP